MGRVLSIVSASLIVFAAGCSGGGNKPSTVTGTVTYKGQPVGAADITFINDKGEKVTGPVNDGKFTIANCPVGDNVKVVVNTQAKVKAFEKLGEQWQGKPSPIENFSKDKVQGDKDQSKPWTAEMKSKLPPEVRAELEQYEYYQKLEEAHKKGTLVQTPKKYESADTTDKTVKITSGQKEPLTITLED